MKPNELLKFPFTATTDCPFRELGDEPYKVAPIRKITVLSYDGNKYCKILVEDKVSEIKIAYVYKGN